MSIFRKCFFCIFVSFACKLNGGRPPTWTEEEEATLKKIVECNNAATWEERAIMFNEIFKSEKSAGECHHRYYRMSGVVYKRHCNVAWTDEEDAVLMRLVADGLSWDEVASTHNKLFIYPRSNSACVSRCRLLKKVAWSSDEINYMMLLVCNNKDVNWDCVANLLNATFCNHRTLSDCIKKWRQHDRSFNNKVFSAEEDELILNKVEECGEKWCIIAKLLDNRSPFAAKARYKILMRRRGVVEPCASDDKDVVVAINTDDVTRLYSIDNLLN